MLIGVENYLQISIPAVFFFLILTLVLAWKAEIGWLRALFAGGFRAGLLTLFLTTLFPKKIEIPTPPLIERQLVSVFVDDSSSMMTLGLDESSHDEIHQHLSQVCEMRNCQISLSYLSEYFPDRSYSHLDEALSMWTQKLRGEPWVIVTDGGDSNSNLTWSAKIKKLGSSQNTGLIVAFRDESDPSLRLSSLSNPLFAFAGKSFRLNVGISRSSVASELQKVQLQVLSGDVILAAQQIDIAAGDLEVSASIEVPPLTKGRHLISARILGSADDRSLLDNEMSSDIDVLADTIGILHLLGAPTWDGRFMRRQLKLEPKYDLVSFYILRDPWDEQVVEERELSLIPFPVDKLFNEELSSFKLVIMQNFSMKRFLSPEHQKNLLKFIEDGGGLLFIGGPRAFSDLDMADSDFKNLLPFESDMEETSDLLNSGMGFLNNEGLSNRQSTGPFRFINSTKFKIRLSESGSEERQIASLYDSWAELFSLSEISTQNTLTFQGYHGDTSSNLKIKKNAVSLLDAEFPGGKRSPLALASFPGRGRAVWLLTDQSWQLAMGQEDGISRQTYSQFYDEALRWLLREELEPPLKIENLSLKTRDQKIIFSFNLLGIGSAALDPDASSSATVEVCGSRLPIAKLNQNIIGPNLRTISGETETSLRQKECWLRIQSTTKKFGDLKAEAVSLFPIILSDAERPVSIQKTMALSDATGGQLEWVSSMKVGDISAGIASWLAKQEKYQGSILNRPSTSAMSSDHFWVFKIWWTYLLMILMIFGEVVVRRWHNLY